VTYRLTQAPNGMIIDALTGLIAWDTAPGNIGTHPVQVELAMGEEGWRNRRICSQ
jgi:hypothetical protein